MTTPKGQLLVVDDEPVILEILKAMLDDEADHIDVAQNGVIALEKMTTLQFDAIVSDISMPQMTGIQMLAEMRHREIDIPVVILTSYSDKGNMLQALRLGAIDFLEKPFDPDKLCQIVRNTLDLGMAYKNCDAELNEIYKDNKLSPEAQQKIKDIKSSSRFLRKTMQVGLKK